MSVNSKLEQGYHANGWDSGYEKYLRGEAVTPCPQGECEGFHPEVYNPELYLPSSRREWQTRVATLCDLMSNASLSPCSEFLYARREDRVLRACVDGVITNAAIAGGLPSDWVECEHPDYDDFTYWDAEQPDRGDTHPFGKRFEYSNGVALPEALLYHGINIEDGMSVLDVLDCDGDFIRKVVNEKHGAVIGCGHLPKLNDQLIKQGVNPLPLFGDIFRHQLERPGAMFWHPRVKDWAD